MRSNLCGSLQVGFRKRSPSNPVPLRKAQPDAPNPAIKFHLECYIDGSCQSNKGNEIGIAMDNRICRCGLLTLVTLLSRSGIAAERPNVILIVTDDQGYGDMSCHGNPWVKTPNLDQLYAKSVRLENYHVEPVCTLTRASLMTGRYSSRVGAWAVTEGRQLLNPDEMTMADVFSKSGYRTGMFGKWHLGDVWPFRTCPEITCRFHAVSGIAV